MRALLIGGLITAAFTGRGYAEPNAWVGTVVLPQGGEITAVGARALKRRGVAPSIGIDVAVAVTPRLTVGISDSDHALGTIDRGGVCLEDAHHPCHESYSGALFDARFLVADGATRLAGLVRAGAVGVGPVRPVVRLGFSARMGATWWAATDPEVQISLGRREIGNRDTLIAPFWLGFGRDRGAFWLRSGLRGQLVDFRDKAEVPVLVGGGLRWGRSRLGGEVGWIKAFGPQNSNRSRRMTAWWTVQW